MSEKRGCGMAGCVNEGRGSQMGECACVADQQTEGDEREWILSEKRQPWSDGPTIRVKPENECSFTDEILYHVVERDELTDCQSRLIAAEQRAEKAGRERDDLDIRLDTARKERREFKADRDRLQRECERLREALRDCQADAHAIATGEPSEAHILEYQSMAHHIHERARLALDALEKPN